MWKNIDVGHLIRRYFCNPNNAPPPAPPPARTLKPILLAVCEKNFYGLVKNTLL